MDVYEVIVTPRNDVTQFIVLPEQVCCILIMEEAMNKSIALRLVIGLAVLGLMVMCAWGYTNLVVSNARSNGEYDSAEAGMLALLDKDYPPDHTVKVYYAGPNEDNRTKPYIWYVTVEVRAASRADGSEMGHNGCDAPGSFFVQLKDGKWVHIPEGFFTTFVPAWLERFGYAGEGETTPTTNLLHGSIRFCQ